MVVKAYKLEEGKSYIYIDRWQSDKPETNMGKLLTMGEFRISGNGNHEPSATLIFENGTKVYDWDDTFKEVKTTTSGGKRKTRRNRKSRKLKKSKSRKNRKKSNRRR